MILKAWWTKNFSKEADWRSLQALAAGGRSHEIDVDILSTLVAILEEGFTIDGMKLIFFPVCWAYLRSAAFANWSRILYQPLRLFLLSLMIRMIFGLRSRRGGCGGSSGSGEGASMAERRAMSDEERLGLPASTDAASVTTAGSTVAKK